MYWAYSKSPPESSYLGCTYPAYMLRRTACNAKSTFAVILKASDGEPVPVLNLRFWCHLANGRGKVYTNPEATGVFGLAHHAFYSVSFSTMVCARASNVQSKVAALMYGPS